MDRGDPTIHAEDFSLSCTGLKSLQFCPILPKFDCRSNFLCSLEISNSIFKFMQKIISNTELKSVQFCLIFA